MSKKNLRKAVRWGFSSHYKCLTDLLREADLHLFRKMTSNSGHCIHQLLPPTKVLPMKLRDSHCVFALPQCHYNLYKHSFVLINLFVWNCLCLLIGCSVTLYFLYCFYFDSLLMLCYAFNLLMAFDRLLLKGLLTYSRTTSVKHVSYRTVLPFPQHPRWWSNGS